MIEAQCDRCGTTERHVSHGLGEFAHVARAHDALFEEGVSVENEGGFTCTSVSGRRVDCSTSRGMRSWWNTAHRGET